MLDCLRTSPELKLVLQVTSRPDIGPTTYSGWYLSFLTFIKLDAHPSTGTYKGMMYLLSLSMLWINSPGIIQCSHALGSTVNKLHG